MDCRCLPKSAPQIFVLIIYRINLLSVPFRVINTLPQGKTCEDHGKEKAMFSSKEMNSIDRSYFTIRFAGCFCIVLQSKNTGHCWQISHEDYGSFQTCHIYHTHHDGTPMHRHGHGRNLESCIAKIKCHDTYQLQKDARKKQTSHRHFRNQRIQNSNLTSI